ncbi:hypothetical protein QJQ45_018228 [Haematococcus lacustris]|nr:hypothetical protein QJQ45_018228 [Haematococcus lacustris]
MPPKRKRKRPVTPAQGAAGPSGSGQQEDEGQGQGEQEVIAERRQVIKAAFRALVEAARPDLSPAQVDAVVAQVNQRMTMGSMQCCLAAVMSLTILLQSFLGQPTPGFPAAGPAPCPPPPPDPACPPYSHPCLPTRRSPRSAAPPAQLPPLVQLDIEDPNLLPQIKAAMDLRVHARQPCELHLPPNQPRPADWVPPAGQVNHRLLRPAWSLRHAKCVRGLKWCHEVPPNPPPPPPPPAPLAQDPHAPAQDLLAQEPPAQAQPPPPAQDQPPAQPPPGPVPRPQAPPWGRWLDRDTNPCLNFQRIGESKQRPLELCRWKDLEALPAIGKEYQQRYKLVNDRLPKAVSISSIKLLVLMRCPVWASPTPAQDPPPPAQDPPPPAQDPPPPAQDPPPPAQDPSLVWPITLPLPSPSLLHLAQCHHPKPPGRHPNSWLNFLHNDESAIKAAHAQRDPATGQVLRQWEWELPKGQLKHDSGLTKAKQDTARWSAAIQPQLQQLAAATPAGTTLDGLHAHILALKATWDPLWEEYLKPRRRRQRLALHHAQERIIEGFCKKGPPAQAQPPPPAQAQPPAQPPPGPVPRPQAPPWGRWLDRDTNPCLNFQRIGESKQRPLELCSWKDLEAPPPIGKEYQQRYKLVNDRLPKAVSISSIKLLVLMRCPVLEKEMAELFMKRHQRAQQLVVFFGIAGIGTGGGGTDQRRGRVVLVDEHRTSRVNSAVNGQQPCEKQLDHERPKAHQQQPAVAQ